MEMRPAPPQNSGAALKLFLAAAFAVAVAIGLALPAPHKTAPATKSQFATFEVGSG